MDAFIQGVLIRTYSVTYRSINSFIKRYILTYIFVFFPSRRDQLQLKKKKEYVSIKTEVTEEAMVVKAITPSTRSSKGQQYSDRFCRGEGEGTLRRGQESLGSYEGQTPREMSAQVDDLEK